MTAGFSVAAKVLLTGEMSRVEVWLVALGD